MGIGLTAAAPASADKPTITDRPIHGSYVLADCGDFQINSAYDGTLRRIITFDDEGNQIKRRSHISVFEILNNSDTGFSVQSVWQLTYVRHFESGTVMITGVGYNITIPGYGTVFFDAGRGLYVSGEDAVEVGNINYQSQEAIDALCEGMDQ
jgi:hypothetical protein